MPTFDRVAAKAAGYSDSEIRAMVAAGPPAVGAYSGAPDEPLQETHPIEDAMALYGGIQLARAAPGMIRATPALGRAAMRGVGGAIEKTASAPILKRIIGAERVAKMGGDLAGLGGRVAAPAAAKPATAAVSRATEKAVKAEAERLATARVASGKAASMEGKTPARSPEVEARIKALASKPNVPKRVATEAAETDRIAIPAHTRARTVPRETSKGRPSRPPLKLVQPEAPRPRPSLPKPKEAPRHARQYFSESRGEHIDIETMNQRHIEQAYGKLARKNPKPGSVAWHQMQDLMAESKHRLQTTGIHVGQTGRSK